MGEALIHSIRGLDEIGHELLVEAEAIAATTSNSDALVKARAELGYVSSLRGDYTAADRWFRRALDAGPGLDDTALIYSRLGIGLSDRGRHEEAIEMHSLAISTAEQSENPQMVAHSQAMLGRAHLMAGSPAAAVSPLQKSLQITKESGWISFRPLPEAFLAQALIGVGAYDEAKGLAQTSFALACEIGDPCWEGLGAYALAMAALVDGQSEEARDRLEDGFLRATRVSDGWSWLNGYILAELCSVLIDVEPDEARARLSELDAIAQPSNMTYLIERSAALRVRLESA